MEGPKIGLLNLRTKEKGGSSQVVYKGHVHVFQSMSRHGHLTFKMSNSVMDNLVSICKWSIKLQVVNQFASGQSNCQGP